MRMNRRTFMAGVGSAVAGGVSARGDDGGSEAANDGPRLEEWSITKGVLRMHVTGVHEDDVLRVHFRACGETWHIDRRVTEYRSDGWHHVSDLEGTNVDPDLWTQAVPVDVEVVR